MIKFIHLAAILAFLTGATSAFAAPVDTSPADKSLVMSKIDPDNDGSISWDEAKVAAVAKFKALDTDNEGTLDAQELTGVLGSRAVKKGDPDKDGSLSEEEYLKVVESMFKTADTDHDGTLDAKELSTESGRALVATLAY